MPYTECRSVDVNGPSAGPADAPVGWQAGWTGGEAYLMVDRVHSRPSIHVGLISNARRVH